jgi:uncharacterized membrane protein
MPNIGFWHPQIVHFVIALLAVGVLARLVSLTGRWAWTSPMATALLLVGTLGAVLGVKSGTDAHGPAERVPGARDAVVEHEEWGERTRNIFLVVAALELAALALRGPRARFRVWATAASGVVGLGGGYAVYETGEHGGELVYAYAGGVGIRSGDTTDVGRLLLAGLYHQAMLDRRAQRPEAAADLIDQMARRWPDDLTIRLMTAESRLVDRQDAKGALAALAVIQVAQNDARGRMRRDFLLSDALAAAGHQDSARAVLEGLARDFPENTRIKDRLARLNRP